MARKPEHDCFKPPAVPTEVHCIHCHREYDSYLIEWREFPNETGGTDGFWCCPMPGCGGKGFGFDIFPTDPQYVGEDGEPMWQWCDDDEDGDYDDEEPGDTFEPFDETRPRFTLLGSPGDILLIPPPKPEPDDNPIKPEHRRPSLEDDIPY